MAFCLSRPPIGVIRPLLVAAGAGILLGLATPGVGRAQSRSADRYVRSASWTSCKVLRSKHGQQTLQGLLARQWIVGFLSGALESAQPVAEPSFRSSDDIMEEVRRYCQAHLNDMAVDAAENMLPVSVRKQ